MGLAPVLDALNFERVDTLVVPFGLAAPGARCVNGHLAASGPKCGICQSRLEPMPDVIDSAVASAMRQGSRVEILSLLEPEEMPRDIGALLRF
jgi:peptide subunit release factor 1 (eRF1)